MSQTATYKGKTYTLLFQGPTKYGRRAHLQFTDGSKDFWVDASLVTVGDQASPQRSSSPRRSSAGGGRCRDCRGPIVNAPHHRAMNGYCGNCAFDEFDC